MWDFAKKLIFRLTELVEIVVSVLTMLFIVLLIVHLGEQLLTQIFYGSGVKMLDGFLNEVLGLVVALEFVKMLIRHTPGTIVEVLLFAFAKLMITSSKTAWELLAGAIAVATLFAIRKFLFSHFDEMERVIYSANLPVKHINWFNHVQLPAEGNQTLADLVEEALTEKQISTTTGAIVYFGHVALRIAKMKDGKISKIEFMHSCKLLE